MPGFAETVKASLSNAKNRTAGIRKTDSQLFVANVVSPAAATLVAALAATVGGNAMFPQAAAAINGWRLETGLHPCCNFRVYRNSQQYVQKTIR